MGTDSELWQYNVQSSPPPPPAWSMFRKVILSIYKVPTLQLTCMYLVVRQRSDWMTFRKMETWYVSV